MKIPWQKNKDQKDPSLTLFHGESASSSVENAAIAYQSPSVIAAGASAGGVALLSTLTNLVLSLLLLKVPSLIEGPHSSIKRTTVIIAIANCFTWVPIVAVMLFFNKVSPLLLTGLWILNIVPSVLAGPLRDNWLANTVPSEKMGRYLSWRSAVSGIFYISSFYLMGYILDAKAGKSSQGYMVIMAFALVASVFSTFMYTRIKPPAQPDTKSNDNSSFGFISFLKQARSTHLGVFILFVSLFTFAVNLSSPLFSSYMLNDLKFSYMTFTAIVSCEYIARIFSLAFWGKMVDKSGSLKVLGLVTYLIPVVPILWIFSHNFYYLAVVQLFSGVVWSAFDLSVQTFIYKATEPAHRLRYIVYYRSLTSFAVALGALAGAGLLTGIFAISGSKILGLFLVSGLLRLVVARVMLPKLTTEGIPGAVIHGELAGELANADSQLFVGGLYYHPEAWSRFSKGAVILGRGIVGKTIGKLAPAKKGLYYHQEEWNGKLPRQTFLGKVIQKLAPSPRALYYAPQKWAEYYNPGEMQTDRTNIKGGLFHDKKAWAEYYSTGQVPANLTNEGTTLPQGGLFYDKQAWADYLTQTSNGQPYAGSPTANSPAKEGLYHNKEAWAEYQKNAAQLAASTNKKSFDLKGLFHNPEQWKSYMKESLLLNATTMKTVPEGASSRQPVFYHPEAWTNYKKETAVKTPLVSAQPVIREQLLYHPEAWNEFEGSASKHKSKKHPGVTVAEHNTKTALYKREKQPITPQSRAASNAPVHKHHTATHNTGAKVPDLKKLKVTPVLV